jgi:hypothetical protein
MPLIRIISTEVNEGKLSEELHQYVIYDTKPSIGLQRIKLDGPSAKVYTPPSSLTVHLSKIPMPELRPQPNTRPPSPPPMPSERSVSASSSPPSSSPRQPPPAWPQAQVRPSSAPIEVQAPTTSTQPPQQQQTTGFGNLLWGRPRKSQP